MSHLKHLIIVLCLCLCWVLPAGRSITPEDIVNLQYVTDAVISPNGNHVAFVLVVPRTDGEEGLAVLSVLEAAEKTIKQTVKLP